MKKILKFHLPCTDVAIISMPYGAKVLDVDSQGGKLYVWALCEDDVGNVNYEFRVHGTGFELPEVHEYEKWYFKTVHVRELGLVWHIFDMNKPI